MKIVDRKSGATFRVTHIDSDHCVYYILEQRVAIQTMKGVRYVWIVGDGKCIIKPEFLAQSTQIQGKALADAQQLIRDAVQGGNECPVCLGSKTLPDDPHKPCGACGGSGRKA